MNPSGRKHVTSKENCLWGNMALTAHTASSLASVLAWLAWCWKLLNFHWEVNLFPSSPSILPPSFPSLQLLLYLALRMLRPWAEEPPRLFFQAFYPLPSLLPKHTNQPRRDPCRPSPTISWKHPGCIFSAMLEIWGSVCRPLVVGVDTAGISGLCVGWRAEP